MSSKDFHIKGLGKLKVSKRRSSRHIRLRVLNDGTISCSIPYWLPYAAGLKFAVTKADWIKSQQQTKVNFQLSEGDLLGKSHRVHFSKDATTPKIALQELIIPANFRGNETELQKIAYRALERDAKQLLPQRLKQLAISKNLDFKSVKVKKMRSRWGSCSSENHINLSVYLVQLPWWLIDYVLLHELVHTIHHNHSSKFWDTLQSHYPKLKLAKQELKKHQLGAIYTK